MPFKSPLWIWIPAVFFFGFAVILAIYQSIVWAPYRATLNRKQLASFESIQNIAWFCTFFFFTIAIVIHYGWVKNLSYATLLGTNAADHASK